MKTKRYRISIIILITFIVLLSGGCSNNYQLIYQDALEIKEVKKVPYENLAHSHSFGNASNISNQKIVLECANWAKMYAPYPTDMVTQELVLLDLETNKMESLFRFDGFNDYGLVQDMYLTEAKLYLFMVGYNMEAKRYDNQLAYIDLATKEMHILNSLAYHSVDMGKFLPLQDELYALQLSRDDNQAIRQLWRINPDDTLTEIWQKAGSDEMLASGIYRATVLDNSEIIFFENTAHEVADGEITPKLRYNLLYQYKDNQMLVHEIPEEVNLWSGIFLKEGILLASPNDKWLKYYDYQTKALYFITDDIIYDGFGCQMSLNNNNSQKFCGFKRNHLMGLRDMVSGSMIGHLSKKGHRFVLQPLAKVADIDSIIIWPIYYLDQNKKPFIFDIDDSYLYFYYY